MKSKVEEKEDVKKNTRSAQLDMFLSIMPYIIIIAFVLIIRIFIADPVKVRGSSMSPTLKNKDYMILYKLTKKIRGLKRFDIVVVKTDSGRIIKRIIGLPGDKLHYEVKTDEEGNETGILYVNGDIVEEDFIDDLAKSKTCYNNSIICESTYIVPEGEYYVMGDNRGNSTDSRILGPIEKDKIMGTAKLIFFPFNRFGNVK